MRPYASYARGAVDRGGPSSDGSGLRPREASGLGARRRRVGLRLAALAAEAVARKPKADEADKHREDEAERRSR
jgi:hypothetical protein